MGRRVAVLVGLVVVVLAAALVLAKPKSTGGFTPDFHRRAAARAAKASGRARLFSAEMSGVVTTPTAPVHRFYEPSMNDGTLSLPATEAPRAPLTPLSVASPLALPVDFSSTTLHAPPADPEAPDILSLPHRVPLPEPPSPRNKDGGAVAPAFFSFRSSRAGEEAGELLDTTMTSPPPLSPLRGVFGAAARAQGDARDPDRDAAERAAAAAELAAPHMTVTPIELPPPSLTEPYDGQPRFQQIHGKAKAKARHVYKGIDLDAPMAMAISGQIVVDGVEQRANKVRPLNIFPKTTVIRLPMEGETAPLPEPAPKKKRGRVLADPFDMDMKEPRDDFGLELIQLEQQQQPKKHRLMRQRVAFHNKQRQQQHEEEEDSDDLSLLEFGQRQRVRSWDAEGERPHFSPHFHHTFRDPQRTREAIEAADERERREAWTERRQHDSAAGLRAPRLDRDWERRNAMLEQGADLETVAAQSEPLTAASTDELASVTGLTPQQQQQLHSKSFPSAPLNLDEFEPFGPVTDAKGLPNAPPRPPPPPLMSRPGSYRNHPMGTLQGANFLATGSHAKRTSTTAAAATTATTAASAKSSSSTKKSEKKAEQKSKSEKKAKKSEKAGSKKSDKSHSSSKKSDKKDKKKSKKDSTSSKKSKKHKDEEEVPSALSMLQEMEQRAGLHVPSLEALAAQSGSGSGSGSADTDRDGEQLSALRRLRALISTEEQKLLLKKQLSQLDAQQAALLQTH